MQEYDEYGNIPEVKNLVDLFVTIDLHQKNKIIPLKKQSVLNQIDQENVFDSLMQQCKKMAQQNNMHPLVIFLLLEDNNWNPDVTQDLILSDPKTVLSHIGIGVEDAAKDPSLRHPSKDGVCEICYGDFSKDELWCLPCGHSFCMECWKGHVTAIVGQGQSRIPCMQVGCACRLPLTAVETIVSKEVYNNLMHYVIDLQVSQNDALTTCPNPHCSKPLYLLGSRNRLCNVLKCVYCKFEFCFQCSEKSHAPSTCSEVKRWNLITDDQLMEQRIFGENCKKCPNCHAIIEKNEGCNHMTCLKCRHEFCWLCMQPWSTHPKTFYECSAYRKEDDPYLKKPDDINPQFLGKYHDEFRERKQMGNEFEEKKMEYIQKIKNRISKDSGIDADQINESIDDLLDQIIWGNYNLQWTHPHQFLSRYDQFKEKNVPFEEQNNPESLPFASSYLLIDFAYKDLKQAVDAAAVLIKNVCNNSIPNLPLKEISKNTKCIRLFREQLLKQCDPHYNSLQK